MDRNPYTVLGVPPTATPEEIKRAFRRGVRRTHPDVVGSHKFVDKFSEIVWAHEILSNTALREVWDQNARHAHTQATSPSARAQAQHAAAANPRPSVSSRAAAFARAKVKSATSRYVCTKCGATNCKLWRDTADLREPDLFCAYCVFEVAGKPVTPIDAEGWRREPSFGSMTDTVGWYVPAAPMDPDALAFWRYTSAPDDAVAWWKNLPTYPELQIPATSSPTLSTSPSIRLPVHPRDPSISANGSIALPYDP